MAVSLCYNKKCSYSEAGSTIGQSKAKVRAYKIVNGKKNMDHGLKQKRLDVVDNS